MTHQVKYRAFSQTRFIIPCFIWTGLIVALLFSFGGAAAYVDNESMEWNSCKAVDSGKRIKIKIGRNNLSYYKVERNKPASFVIRGPAYVKLISRQLPPKKATGKFTYTMTVMRDRRGELTEILGKEVVTAWSSRARLNSNDNDFVGEPEDNYLYVPKGKHTLIVDISDKDCAVAVRMFVEKRIVRDEMISLTPSDFERVCLLVQTSGNEYPHYRFTHEKPLHFTVVGPTTVNIGTRLDFESDAPQTSSYALMITGRNAEGRTLDEGGYFKTKKLSRTTYKDCPGIAPGDNQVMELKVPSGRWAFELSLINSDHSGVTARILMPKSDLDQSTP